jgi:hypothetical protein
LNAKRHPYIGAAVGTVLLVAAYYMISVVVLRAAPHPSAIANAQPPAAIANAQPRARSSAPPALNWSSRETPHGISDYMGRIVSRALGNVPLLSAVALDRMALAYPYYYEIFTTKGAICGGVEDVIARTQPCRPSLLVYERMFNDPYAGRGTAPAAVHISAYALGGWPIAMLALIAAGFILGCFAALPQEASATAATIAVMGSLAAYFFSQIPGEQVIINDHGILWWGLLVLAYAGARRLIAPTASLQSFKGRK